MKDEKLYAERDHRALKPRYSGDISAMTAEDLREKGDILDKLVRREEGGDDMSKLREAARAVVDQWDTPNWNLDMHTGVLIDRLRAALAQPETAEPVAWAVVCAGNAVSTCLTETAANLIAENLREKNRGRDFDWQTTPLYAHPPRDEWRPASERPTGAHDVEINVIVTGHYDDIAGCWRDTECALARRAAADGGRAMSEDRPQYQAANKSFGDPTPTPIELAKKLRYLSNDIMVLSAEIQYVGGFGQMANIASAMELSARNLRAWAYDIEEAQG